MMPLLKKTFILVSFFIFSLYVYSPTCWAVSIEQTVNFDTVTSVQVRAIEGNIFIITGTHNGNPVSFEGIAFNLNTIASKWNMDGCEKMALLAKSNPEKYNLTIKHVSDSAEFNNYNGEIFQAACTLN